MCLRASCLQAEAGLLFSQLHALQPLTRPVCNVEQAGVYRNRYSLKRDGAGPGFLFNASRPRAAVRSHNPLFACLETAFASQALWWTQS